MGKMKSFGPNCKIYTGKDGFTSTFTKIKVNQGSKWIRSGGTEKMPRGMRKVK